jgi:hypothetical protein
MNEERSIDWDGEPYPPTHDFSKNPVIEGEIVLFGEVPGLTDDKGREYVGVFMQVKTKNGVETVWMSTVIKSKSEAHGAAVGDWIGIKQLDAVKSTKTQYTYTDFDVRCIHAME